MNPQTPQEVLLENQKRRKHSTIKALLATTLVSDQLYYDQHCDTPFDLSLKLCNEKLS